ncbi:MAG: helix-turn-helix domain-containing protein [Mycobacteriales bacterium]
MDEDTFAADTLRAARRRAELSQRALALAAGVPPAAVAAYESGNRQPSARMLARLVRASGAHLGIVEPSEQQQRQKHLVEAVVAAATALPHRPAADLEYPTFRSLTGR